MQDMNVKDVVSAQEMESFAQEEIASVQEEMEVVRTQQRMGDTVQYAGFFTRLGAFCIDSFIAGLLLLAVRIPMLVDIMGGSKGVLSTKVLFEFSGWDILIYLLTCFYFVALTYHSGATIGKRLFRIKVISADEEKLSFTDVLYRETIGRFLNAVAMNVGYLMVGIDKEKRGFHDMLCDTRVVYDFEEKQEKRSTKKTENCIDKANSELSAEIMSGEKEVAEKKTPVSMAPSNYGYVPKSQKKQTEDILEIEKQTEEHAVDSEQSNLEEKE